MLNIEDIRTLTASRERYETFLYTPLAEAYRELKRRWQDKQLARRIERFLQKDIPSPLGDAPKAVLTRSVMSPNFETRRFGELVEEQGILKPLYLEYHSDKFVPNNESKRMLGRLYFFHGHGKRGGAKVVSHTIVNFSMFNGSRMSSVSTVSGQDFIDFHHHFFDECYRKISHTFFDTSAWLKAHGGKASDYYEHFLALFIRHGILFENILLNKEERPFTSNILLPAFIAVSRRFGLKPLIARLEPVHGEESRHWMCYPGGDEHYVLSTLRKDVLNLLSH